MCFSSINTSVIHPIKNENDEFRHVVCCVKRECDETNANFEANTAILKEFFPPAVLLLLSLCIPLLQNLNYRKNGYGSGRQ